MMNNLNGKYVELYKQYHQLHPEYGNGGALRFYLNYVVDLIHDTKSQSLLDYGFGKAEGYLKHNHHRHWDWGIMPALYDPAIEQFKELPDGPFDGVICLDVLEHIPEEEIPQTLKNIYDRANKFVFLGIDTGLANAVLPDGNNAHCTIKSKKWWADMIKEHGTKVYTHIVTNGQDEGYQILNEESYLEML